MPQRDFDGQMAHAQAVGSRNVQQGRIDRAVPAGAPGGYQLPAGAQAPAGGAAQGSDAMLGVGAQAQVIANAAREIATSLQMALRYSKDIADNFGALAGGAFPGGEGTRRPAGAGGGRGGSIPHRDTTDYGPSSDPLPPLRLHGPEQATLGPRPGTPQEEQSRDQRFPGRFREQEFFHGGRQEDEYTTFQRMSNMRMYSANMFGRQLTDPNSSAGRLLSNLRRDGSAAGASRAARMGGALGGGVQRGVQAAAMGGGLGQMGMMALGRAGPWGMAAMGAVKGVQMIGEQRELGREYQAALGGSNVEGQFQRMGEVGFGVSAALGGMSQGKAQELYKGTTMLGMRGGERAEALATGTKMYKNLGMDTQQSLETMQIAIANGVNSFGQLERSLTAVSKAARHAGVNAELVRQSFNQNLQAAGGITTGGSSVALGTAMTLATAGQGRHMQGTGVDMTSSQSLIELTAVGGLGNTGTTAALAQDNPAAFGALQGQRVAAYNPIPRELTEAVKNSEAGKQVVALIQKQGLASAASDPVMDQYMEQLYYFFNKNAAQFGFDPIILMPAAQKAGAQVNDPKQASMYFIRQMFGLNDPGALAAEGELQTKAERKRLGAWTGKDERKAAGKPEGASIKDYNPLAPFTSKGRDMGGEGSAAQAVGGTTTDSAFAGWRDESHTQSARNEYVSQVKKDIRGRSPVAEALLADSNTDTRIAVKQNNKWNVVGKDEAVKYFTDQLEAGIAIMANGPDQGKSVAEAFGIAKDEGVASRITNTNDKASSLNRGTGNGPGKVIKGDGGDGKTFDSAEQATAAAASAGEGGSVTTVNVIAEPALRDYLKFVPSPGNATKDDRGGQRPSPDEG